MSFPWKEHPERLQIVLGAVLLLFLLIVAYALGFLRPSASALELFARANGTRTSIALTSQSILGPFPTATGPTPTPSHTPSITPTPTGTPTATPSPTRFRYFYDTGTPRTLVPGFDLTSTFAPPAASSTLRGSTSVPPTNPPRQPTSQPPQSTSQPPRPTHERKPTKTPRSPRPTKTPRHLPLAACFDLQGCSYFLSEKLSGTVMGLAGPDKALRQR